MAIETCLIFFEKDDVIFTSEFDGSVRVEVRCGPFFRYETMLVRSIYKALHELERLQARRRVNKSHRLLLLIMDVSGEKDSGSFRKNTPFMCLFKMENIVRFINSKSQF